MTGEMEEVTKAEAARRFGVSERSLERATKSGRLRPKREKKPGGGEILYFDVSELTAWKEGQNLKVDRTHEPIRSDTSAVAPSVALSEPSRALATLIEAIQRAEQGDRRPDSRSVAVPIESRLTLSMDEANRLSGIPVAQLRAAAKANEITAVKIGRGLRVRRDDLQRYVDSLFVPAD
jgi:excisionase family DNA binding protein